ncbi:TetR/AcrR family transcriptional regulator [Nocardia sp. alder85J]|uniref:TetR/AcrR family transcriptional regulator n=1 Tax=Nocardia sp. alder85J TaxID=2862949 RepID=UPI001CD67F60|nr:TetR/AcrR family transcriptional regulator [Nocardia sp. alder85J]MCX4092924.1 helix-turn-helix domain containing protein [Nocardia sp. alder85J]
MTSAARPSAWDHDSRQRFLDAAVALFVRHSFAGTSLQMVADELGVTKAAVYYHFRTRDQLLLAVMEPMLSQLREVIRTAEQQRGPRAQAESMLTGYAAMVAAERSTASVLTTDPSVLRVLRHHEQWRDVIDRPPVLLAAADPGPLGPVHATAVLTGLAGAASGAPAEMDADALAAALLDTGRRILGLRPPRRKAP